MLFRRNNLNIGIGLGILVPFATFSILTSLIALTGLTFKTRSIALIAICLNMLVMQGFRKNRANESIRGLVITTFAMAILWFTWFYKEITAEW